MMMQNHHKVCLLRSLLYFLLLIIAGRHTAAGTCQHRLGHLQCSRLTSRRATADTTNRYTAQIKFSNVIPRCVADIRTNRVD